MDETQILELFSDSPVSWKGIITAFVCGGIVGIERQVSGKPAGIRTSILICMGAYAFTILAVTHGMDTRIIGQMVTGVGFLGAGVILAREGIVIGVTSASVIWVLASIGSFIGFGHYPSAIVLALVTVFVLVGITFLENRFKSLRRGVHKRGN